MISPPGSRATTRSRRACPPARHSGLRFRPTRRPGGRQVRHVDHEPTDSCPGAHSAFSSLPAASSRRAMHRVVASTAGKSSPVIGFQGGGGIGLRDRVAELERRAFCRPAIYCSERRIFSSRLRCVISSRASAGTIRAAARARCIPRSPPASAARPPADSSAEEVREGLAQVLRGDPVAAIGDGAELGADQRGLDVRPDILGRSGGRMEVMSPSKLTLALRAMVFTSSTRSSWDSG